MKTEFKNGEYRCYDERMDFIVFSGYGKTPKEAEINYHLNWAELLKKEPIFKENIV